MSFSEHLRIEPAIVLEKHTAEIIDIRFSADEQQIAASDGNRKYIWQLEQTGGWKRHPGPGEFGAFLGFFGEEKRLLFFDEETRQMREYSYDGVALARIQTSLRDPFGYVFSPDHRWFLTGNHRGQIALCDATTFAFVAIFQVIPHEEFSPYEKYTPIWLGSFQFTPDGQTLVFLGLSTKGFLHVCAFDTVQPMLARKATLPQARLNGMKMSVSGRLLAGSLSDENSIEVYETGSLRRLMRVQTPKYPCCLALSPDEAFVACATDDGYVSIWSLRTHRLLSSFLAHPGVSSGEAEPITALEWSPRGEVLVTGGCDLFAQYPSLCDYSVKLWRIQRETSS